MGDWIIEPFGTRHQRDDFSCGKPPLDAFIRTRVSQYEKRRLGKAFVAVPKSESKIIGYYRYGFTARLDEPLHLYLSISTVEDLLG